MSRMRNVSRGARPSEVGERRCPPMASTELTLVVITHCQYPLAIFLFGFLVVFVVILILSACKHLAVKVHGSKLVLDSNAGY